jgi:hypothetical protein
MTNAESNLQEAIEKRDNGKLNTWEENFVSQFEGWTKKQLRNLTYNQFCKLREIAKKP